MLSGITTILTRKASMVLLVNFQNISKKEKNQENRFNMKMFGSKSRYYFRHNFNGTSKGFGETLAKPSPVPSQMVLNSLRRNNN